MFIILHLRIKKNENLRNLKMIKLLQKRFFSTIPTFRSQASSLVDIFSSPKWIYIDKTKHMAEMMLDPTDLMFFNRPRRFGKSMILQGLEHCYNTKLRQTEAIKGRNLQIFSPNPFGNDAPKNEIWSSFREELDSQNFVAIKLDFSNLKRYASIGQFQEGLCLNFKRRIEQCIYAYKTYHNQTIKSALEKSLNSQTVEDILDCLTQGSSLKLVLLIDEYEAPLMECLKPRFKNHYDEIETQYNSFFSNIKSAKEAGLAKCVMTGVLCLRNLSAFSDANSFLNLSLAERYREAFGFTREEIENNPQVQKLMDHILTNRPIPSDVENLSILEKRKHFINEMFKVYNGFCFTSESLTNHISLISPISIVGHITDIMENTKANPYRFHQYWAGTGQTTMIKYLAIENLDPTESYDVLVKAKTQKLDLEILKKPHSIKVKLLPLNLLLFNTGYFTIKNIDSKDLAELDWTNQETKEAFYEHYVDGLGFKINDLFHSLMVSKPFWCMKQFVVKFNDYFGRMLKKHYRTSEGQENEQNVTFNFFLELLEYLPRSQLSKSDSGNIIIYNQYKLIELMEFDLRKGKMPDIFFLFSDHAGKTKQILFVEFYKWFLFLFLFKIICIFFLTSSTRKVEVDHFEKSRLYPNEFLKSRLLKSSYLEGIKGKFMEMHVLLIGYEIEIEPQGQEQKIAKHFREIKHIPYELHQNRDVYDAKIIEEKINNIKI